MGLPDPAAWNRIRYSIYAPIYDRVAAVFDAPRRRSIDGLNLRADESVLIIGCGSGRDLLYLPKDVHLTAGDITPAMVRRTKSRAMRLDMHVDAHVFDAASLPFESERFDAVILHLVVAVVPDPDATIREAARVLRPGGRAAVFDKFLQQDRRPSLIRRAANVAARFLFSDINRRAEPLLDAAGFEVTSDIDPVGGGIFRIIQAHKPG